MADFIDPEMNPEEAGEEVAPSMIYPEIMIPVASSNVQEFGYVPEEQTLFVRFLDKGRGSAFYVYRDVEPEVYQAFMASESKGKFIWSDLRGRYEYERIE